MTIKAPRYDFNDPITGGTANFNPNPTVRQRPQGVHSSLEHAPRNNTKSMSPEPFIRSPVPLMGQNLRANQYQNQLNGMNTSLDMIDMRSRQNSLPSSSGKTGRIFKFDNAPRLGKTVPRTNLHDPITGEIRKLNIQREIVAPLDTVLRNEKPKNRLSPEMIFQNLNKAVKADPISNRNRRAMAPAAYISPYEIPRKEISPTPSQMSPGPELSKFDYGNYYKQSAYNPSLKRDVFKRAVF